MSSHPETQKFTNTTKVAPKKSSTPAPAPVATKAIEVKPKVAAEPAKPKAALVVKPKATAVTKNTSTDAQSVQIDSSQDLESTVQLTKNDPQEDVAG